MPFAQVALPLREQAVVRRTQPGRLHRRVHRPDARLVLHDARAVRRAVRSSRRSRTVICHGVVLDGEGPKLSKKLRNYPDPAEVFETVGSDALRWYLVSLADPARSRSAHRAGRFRHHAKSSAWSSIRSGTPTTSSRCTPTSMGTKPSWRTDSSHLLDRYILAKTQRGGRAVTAPRRLRPGRRRARRRRDSSMRSPTGTSAAAGNGSGRCRRSIVDADALDTLYTVLVTLTQDGCAPAPL